MQTVLQGQISASEGLREALEIVLSIKDVQNGVLSIDSDAVRGRVGIFCGRFITGAITESGDSGKAAVKKLLSVKSGKFKFDNIQGEPAADLKQELSLDLSTFLQLAEEFDQPTIALSSEFYKLDEASSDPDVFIVDSTSTRPETDLSPEIAAPQPAPEPKRSASGFNAASAKRRLTNLEDTMDKELEVPPEPVEKLASLDDLTWDLQTASPSEKPKLEPVQPPVQEKPPEPGKTAPPLPKFPDSVSNLEWPEEDSWISAKDQILEEEITMDVQDFIQEFRDEMAAGESFGISEGTRVSPGVDPLAGLIPPLPEPKAIWQEQTPVTPPKDAAQLAYEEQLKQLAALDPFAQPSADSSFQRVSIEQLADSIKSTNETTKPPTPVQTEAVADTPGMAESSFDSRIQELITQNPSLLNSQKVQQLLQSHGVEMQPGMEPAPDAMAPKSPIDLGIFDPLEQSASVEPEQQSFEPSPQPFPKPHFALEKPNNQDASVAPLLDHLPLDEFAINDAMNDAAFVEVSRSDILQPSKFEAPEQLKPEDRGASRPMAKLSFKKPSESGTKPNLSSLRNKSIETPDFPDSAAASVQPLEELESLEHKLAESLQADEFQINQKRVSMPAEQPPIQEALPSPAAPRENPFTALQAKLRATGTYAARHDETTSALPGHQAKAAEPPTAPPKRPTRGANEPVLEYDENGFPRMELLRNQEIGDDEFAKIDLSKADIPRTILSSRTAPPGDEPQEQTYDASDLATIGQPVKGVNGGNGRLSRSAFQKTLKKRDNTVTVILLLAFAAACGATVYFGPHLMHLPK